MFVDGNTDDVTDGTAVGAKETDGPADDTAVGPPDLRIHMWILLGQF